MADQVQFRADLWDQLVLHKDEAQQFIETVDDPVVRELLGKAEGALKMRFFQKTAIDDETYRKTLPDQPFDMLFYIQLFETVVRKKEGLRYLLDHGPDDSDELFALWFS